MYKEETNNMGDLDFELGEYKMGRDLDHCKPKYHRHRYVKEAAVPVSDTV